MNNKREKTMKKFGLKINYKKYTNIKTNINIKYKGLKHKQNSFKVTETKRQMVNNSSEVNGNEDNEDNEDNGDRNHMNSDTNSEDNEMQLKSHLSLNNNKRNRNSNAFQLICDKNKDRISDAKLHQLFPSLKCLAKEDKRVASEEGIDLNSGKFSAEEEQQLLTNWEHFCGHFIVGIPHLFLGLFRHRKDWTSLITDNFPTLCSSRKRLPSKVLALQKEKIIRHYISSKCDPIDSLTIEDIDIKGKGVMASKPISKGSFICEYSGDLVRLKEAKLRELEYESVGVGSYMYYFKWSNTVWCVDATHPTGRYGRLINHSRKSPNCKTRVFVHNRTPHLIFIAIKDIEPNQEILYDYGETDKSAIEANPWLSST